MLIRLLKNTVLFFVMIQIACAGGSEKNQEKANEENAAKVDLPIISGADRMSYYLPLLKGKRIAVVANQTSVLSKHRDFQSLNPNKPKYKPETLENYFTHLVDTLLARDIEVVKVFSPEHGFRGTADAGEAVKDGIDSKTNLTIISLYGKNKKPTPQQLDGVELLLFDIQDVGVRFYTYLSTLHYIMEAAAEHDIPVIVLDRPNPNGNYIDGPTMEEEHISFLGLHPVPLVYGMTIGEYAQMINGENWLANGIKADLTVIELENYSHDSYYSLPIKPSPNLPNDQAVKLYPSLGLFEGTNINAGRGTDFQFQRYGAPFLDSGYFYFEYIPESNEGAKNPKHLGKTCYGEDLSQIEFDRGFSLKWILKAYRHSNDKEKFFNSKNFTAHAGTTLLQKQIESGLTEEEIKGTWKESHDNFRRIRQKYLLYK